MDGMEILEPSDKDVMKPIKFSNVLRKQMKAKET
jgi:hypothetical protein